MSVRRPSGSPAPSIVAIATGPARTGVVATGDAGGRSATGNTDVRNGGRGSAPEIHEVLRRDPMRPLVRHPVSTTSKPTVPRSSPRRGRVWRAGRPAGHPWRRYSGGGSARGRVDAEGRGGSVRPSRRAGRCAGSTFSTRTASIASSPRVVSSTEPIRACPATRTAPRPKPVSRVPPRIGQGGSHRGRTYALPVMSILPSSRMRSFVMRKPSRSCAHVLPYAQPSWIGPLRSTR